MCVCVRVREREKARVCVCVFVCVFVSRDWFLTAHHVCVRGKPHGTTSPRTATGLSESCVCVCFIIHVYDVLEMMRIANVIEEIDLLAKDRERWRSIVLALHAT